jgi:hemolysin D
MVGPSSSPGWRQLYRRGLERLHLVPPAVPATAVDPAEAVAGSEFWTFNQTVLLRKTGRPSSWLLWTLVASTGGVVLWAVLAPLDESIAVSGKLEPGSKVRRIEAPAPGLVQEVLVKEGQSVRRGQPLLRFDLRAARSKLNSALAIRERLVNENALNRATLGDGQATGLTPHQRQQLSDQRQSLASRMLTAQEEVRKSQARLSGLEDTLATASDLYNRFRGLAASGSISEVQVLESANKVKQLQADLAAERHELARAQANLAGTLPTTGVDLRGRVEANLRQIADLDNQISDARRLLQYGQLASPVEGVVFDITVGPGNVVTDRPERPLMKVVPPDALQARVYVPNQAIGFVRPGQQADVSLESFPAGEYGRLPATVQQVGSDALTPEEQARVLGTQVSGLFFPATLHLKRQHLVAGSRQVPLQAGMALTADVKLRQRRFISVLIGFFEDKRRSLERVR